MRPEFMKDIALKDSMSNSRHNAHHSARLGVVRQLVRRIYLAPLVIAVGLAIGLAIWQGLSADGQNVNVLILATGVLVAGGYFSARIAKAQMASEGQKALSAVRETLERAVFQAQASAATANQEKAESIDRLSRAVRVHLNHILSTTELVSDGGLTDQQQDYLQEVKDAAGYLANVISDGMDLSAIGSGRMELESINFNLRSCLEHVVEGIRPRATARSLDVETIVATGVPETLLGDPGRLRQILGNLLGNAIKSTEHGHLSVCVSRESQASPAGDLNVLHFVVADSGRGLSPARLELLGRMFRNPSAFSGSDADESALLISAQLVELMGGRMWAQNQACGGSEFHFSAGLKVGTAAAVTTEQLAVSLRDRPVMIAGSNTARLSKLKQILSDAQMHVATAGSTQDAMAILRLANQAGRPIGLAILDDDSQDMDAFDVSERIAQDKTIATPTLFVVTSNGQRGDAARCARIGITAYLAGPITSSILLSALRAAIRRPGGDDAAGLPLLTRHLLREMETQHVLVDG
jgi:two-component system sensor histidine kinase/response regulator